MTINTAYKRRKESRTMIGAYMEADLADRLDAICFATGKNRSDVLRMLVGTASIKVTPPTTESKEDGEVTIPPIEAEALHKLMT